MKATAVVCASLSLIVLPLSRCYHPGPPLGKNSRHRRRVNKRVDAACPPERNLESADTSQEQCDAPNLREESTVDRRRLLFSAVASVGSSVLGSAAIGPASASTKDDAWERTAEELAAVDDNHYDVNCLSDLPPLPSDTVRLYLCRHGQTENNRLHLIQGAQVDPPLNHNGISQAQRLGRALVGAKPVPSTVFHSRLRRARQTAEVAVSTAFPPSTQVSTLPDLGEVDFGSVADGKPASLVRAQMTATYTAWAMGDIDVHADGGGESGREVFFRIENALQALVRAAMKSPTRSVAAVAHSAYLRMLLAVVKDKPLLEAAAWEQRNACVDVLDVRLPLGDAYNQVRSEESPAGNGASPLEAPPFASRPSGSFALQIPDAIVVRMNEKRHLDSAVSYM